MRNVNHLSAELQAHSEAFFQSLTERDAALAVAVHDYPQGKDCSAVDADFLRKCFLRGVLFVRLHPNA